ncbi:MAG: aldose epimerase [Opitutales bacterium]|nr:aldose epimerase [Opitutales bacterium]
MNPTCFTYQDKPVQKWQIGRSTFLASVENGARLMFWNLDLPDGTSRPILYWPEEANYSRFSKIRGGNPLLFPFAGASYVDSEAGFWEDQRQLKRPMPQHGFLRQGKCEILDLQETGFRARFLPDETAKEGYPFQYELLITYRFSELAFFVDLTLQNDDREPIPWAAGHHFYFAAPWTEGKSRSEYEVMIPHRRAFRQNPEDGDLEALKPLGKVVTLDNPELWNRIHTGLRSNEFILREKGEDGHLLIRTNENKGFLNKMACLTWSESAESPYYCVEPWMAPPNSWTDPEGLHWVEPGKSQNFYTEVRIVPPEFG